MAKSHYRIVLLKYRGEIDGLRALTAKAQFVLITNISQKRHIITGLRPGEKLHEEMFIGESIGGTRHSAILQAHETFISLDELQPYLEALSEAARTHDCIRGRGLRRKTAKPMTDNINPPVCLSTISMPSELILRRPRCLCFFQRLNQNV